MNFILYADVTMTVSPKELEKMARLTYLNLDSNNSSQLNDEINSIIEFVDKLRALDTSKVAPLFHPLALHQRMRADEVTEEECIADLEQLAPLFEDNLYLVPKVIESGN